MRRRLQWVLLVGSSLIGAVGLASGCSAGATDGTTSGPGAGPGGTGGDNTGGAGPAGPGVTSGGGQIFVTSSGTGGGEGGGVPINPCGTECGPTELCDGIHKGIDDDCDGEVDEGCPCGAGTASACFRGDPSYRNTPGCFDGTMYCTELGTWGPCTGGVHASAPDLCFEASTDACHPINAVPFQTVDLTDGAGTFYDSGSTNTFEVECPVGVDPCPAVTGGSNFQPLQSGEYTVTYTKTGPGGTETCTFPLIVGARGLRVEMEWNWGGGSRDLDLHLHQPSNLQGWAPTSFGGSNSSDCTWHNCTVDEYGFLSTGPEWFPQPPQPVGSPVAWYLDPVQQANTCYYAPRGVGADWQALGKGCHNPRLDLDNVSCTLSVSNVNDPTFCAPENVNVDFPPNNQWFRVGVFNFTTSPAEPLTPTIKIYCDGALAAELGPEGFNAPVAVPGRQMWLTADVLFQDDGCTKRCVVQPIYQNAAQQTPYFMTESQANTSVGPAFQPIPQP